MKSKVILFLTIFAACFVFPAGLKGAAEPMPQFAQAVLTADQTGNGISIAMAIMQNRLKVVQFLLANHFSVPLLKYTNPQDPLKVIEALCSLVETVLEMSGKNECMQNQAGSLFANTMSDRTAELLGVCQPSAAAPQKKVKATPQVAAPKPAKPEQVQQATKPRMAPAQPQPAQVQKPAPTQVRQPAQAPAQKPAQAQQQAEKPAVQQLQLNAGVDAQQGRRPKMEDEHDMFNGSVGRFAVYAVYDGHGGSEVSSFLKKTLTPCILEKIGQYENPTYEQITDKILEAFAEVESKITDEKAGSTAVVVLIDKQEGFVYCANLGDSRAVLCSGGGSIALSHDHKVENLNDIEEQKIKDAGGLILWGRIMNFSGFGWAINVTRAFGDKDIKKGRPALAKLMSEPEIQMHKITSQDQFLILACDGLWDVMPKNEDVVKFVSDCLNAHPGDLHNAAHQLVQHAIDDPNKIDNVTAMIVTLH